MKAINTIHRLLLGAAFTGGALFAVSLATDGAAHADDTPAVVSERPGGPLGDLPDQASDTARAAVAKVAPNPKPTKPADKPKPKPAKDPKPTKPPAAEPTHAPKPPVEVPPVEVPPVVVDPPPVVIETPPVVIEPTPVPTLPAPIPTLPVEDPPATPTGPVPLPTIPVPAVPALPPLPGLPDPIGPTEPPPAGIVAQLVTSLTAGVPDQPADCTDNLDAIHVDLKRITIPVNLRPHPTATATASGPPCPGTPGTPDGPALTALSVKPPPPNGQQLVADSVAGAYSRPVLHRLTQLRPRGDLPAGRTEHPEPGPA